MTMKFAAAALAVALLSACAADPVTGEKRSAVERINAGKDAAKAGIEAAREIREARCAAGIEIEGLKDCPEEE